MVTRTTRRCFSSCQKLLMLTTLSPRHTRALRGDVITNALQHGFHAWLVLQRREQDVLAQQRFIAPALLEVLLEVAQRILRLVTYHRGEGEINVVTNRSAAGLDPLEHLAFPGRHIALRTRLS